jgi:hypothetical protein
MGEAVEVGVVTVKVVKVLPMGEAVEMGIVAVKAVEVGMTVVVTIGARAIAAIVLEA